MKRWSGSQEGEDGMGIRSVGGSSSKAEGSTCKWLGVEGGALRKGIVWGRR